MTLRASFVWGITAMMAMSVFAQAKNIAQNIGENNNLSIELPKKLDKPVIEEIDDKDDWVTKLEDYTVETDDFIVQISVLHGKKGTEADNAFLKQVLKDILEGISEAAERDTVKEIGVRSVTIDKKSGLRSTHRIGTGDNQFFMKSTLIGDGNKVYAIVGVYTSAGGNTEKSVTAILDSVRCVPVDKRDKISD